MPNGGREDWLIELHQPAQSREFNDALVESIDETITGLLSREVANALHTHLLKVHAISRDEIPYRLETLFSTLEETFGLTSSKTIGKVIARNLYAKLGLSFHDNPSRTLLEYVEEAKIKLRE